MNRFCSILRAPVLALLGAGLFAPAQAQSYGLRADIASGGATEAASGDYTLRGTVGQAAAGPVASAGYTLGGGFWYPATLLDASPPPALVVSLTPLDLPISIPPGGGTFQFQVSVTNTTGQTQSFQGWTDATLPNGNPFGPVLGPQNLTLAPGATFGPVTLSQQVPGAAPSGAYNYNAYAGTFPDTVVDSDSFPFSKAAALSTRRRTTGADVQSVGAREDAELALGRPAAGEVTANLAEPVPSEWVVLVTATGETVAPRDGLADAALAEATLADETPADTELRKDAADGEEVTALDSAALSEAAATALPTEVALRPAFPNPFAARTTLRFALPEAAEVRLLVYDALGRAVARLAEGWHEAGRHEAVFDGQALAAGLYLARLEVHPVRGDAAGTVQTQRITLLR